MTEPERMTARERKLERDRQRYAANRDRLRAQQAAYYAMNSERLAVMRRAQRATTRDHRRAYTATYYAANRERILTRDATYRAANNAAALEAMLQGLPEPAEVVSEDQRRLRWMVEG